MSPIGHLGGGNREGWEIAGGRHGDTPKIVAGVRAAEGVVEAQLGTGRAIGCCRGVCGGLEITGCTRYRGHRADIVVYNCWPPLPYHHLHFSGPSSSSSHPLHYPGDPYYVNSVASEMSVVRPTSQVCAGCCSAPRTRGVGGTGVTPKVVDIYLDGVAGGSGRPFSAGLILFLEAGTTFSGYLQQQIGDNQWDKICILGWKGRRTFEQEAGAEDRDE